MVCTVVFLHLPSWLRWVGSHLSGCASLADTGCRLGFQASWHWGLGLWSSRPLAACSVVCLTAGFFPCDSIRPSLLRLGLVQLLSTVHLSPHPCEPGGFGFMGAPSPSQFSSRLVVVVGPCCFWVLNVQVPVISSILGLRPGGGQGAPGHVAYGLLASRGVCLVSSAWRLF